MADEIEVGDTVTIGKGKVHWTVVRMFKGLLREFDVERVEMVALRSQMSDKTVHVPLADVTLHTKGA